MIAQEMPALLFTGGIVAGFVLLVAMLLIQRARLRKWKRAHGLIRGDYRALLDSHAKLRAQAVPALTDADRTLLENLAEELRGCLVTFDEDTLLDGAEAIDIATIPVPVLEIEYPDRLVTLRLEVEHYSAEEVRA